MPTGHNLHNRYGCPSFSHDETTYSFVLGKIWSEIKSSTKYTVLSNHGLEFETAVPASVCVPLRAHLSQTACISSLMKKTVHDNELYRVAATLKFEPHRISVDPPAH
jgi:hypothetical protein